MNFAFFSYGLLYNNYYIQLTNCQLPTANCIIIRIVPRSNDVSNNSRKT
jgi:hypothetical protein